MSDYFNGIQNSLQQAAAVTPSDATQLTPPNGDSKRATRGILVGGAGTLVVLMADSSGPVTLTIPATACGTILPLAVTFVRAATTATNIVAFW